MLRNPEYITELGLGDTFGIGNDQLTNISDAYIRETQQLEKDSLAMLQGYDRAELTSDQQLSYDIYEWELEDRVQGHQFMYYDYPITHFITGVQNQTLFLFTDLHPITDIKDVEDYITRLSQVDTKFEQLIEGLELRRQAGVIAPRMILQWSSGDIQRIANTAATRTPYYLVLAEKLSKVDSINQDQKNALLQQAEEQIDSAVIPAYKNLDGYLRELIQAAPTQDGVWQFPNGDDYYEYILKHHTTTDLSAEQIHQLGLAEVERIQNEMGVIFAELGYSANASLSEQYARVAEDSGVLQGSQLVAAYEAIIDRVQAQMDNWFDRQPSAEVIVIGGDTGGFYVSPAVDGSRPGAFYASIRTSQPRYAMASLAYHEAIPGHHTQSALAGELDLPILRRDAFFTGYVEGWALYAEQLAKEMGIYESDPYGDLGRLQYELFRAVRLVVDTGIHAKKWSFDQAVKYMIENTGYAIGSGPINPEYEIARYIAWPGQATAYKTGMLKILEVRQKAQEELGERFDIKEFHDIVLTNGAMPLEILEQVANQYIAEGQDR